MPRRLAQTTAPSRHTLSALLLAAACALTAGGAAHATTPVAPGVTLVPGAFVPGRQPDGNSVIIRAPDGLIVIDSGRHPAHAQQIIDYAIASKLPIRAVINSHWHLDHVGGNPMLRRAYPGLRVHAGAAIEDAMRGFLADYRAQLQAGLDKTGGDAAAQAPLRAELALIDAGKALYPDVAVTASGTRRIAGRTLDLHLQRDAVTAGDVWVFDPATRLLVAGDLVTLPVPFLDTACPERWKAALNDLAAVDFAVLVPGHGAPMDRAAFASYRIAFGHLLACAASAAPKSACIDGWSRDAAPLLTDADPQFVRALLDYYMDTSLRADAAHTAKLCRA